ncbi:MAG: CRISPR-associated endonuclease Cas2 [Akkermansia sp.]|nr:CRISPR-associated endonuclease Cas2 [Akkermansia sp.]
MLYLISYDVSTSTPAGRKRLRQVAKVCEDYGVRVQNSVFECVMDYSTFLQLKSKLGLLIDAEHDSLRFYPIGKKGREKVVHIGSSAAPDVEAPLIF